MNHNPSLSVLFVLGAFISSSTFATELQNCDLKTIPKSAKPAPAHGASFITYPPQIDSSYSGCQIVWLEDGHKLSTTLFRDGKGVWMKVQEPKGKSFFCAFDQGVLITKKSDVKNCPETMESE
jgi:hypothetical protein